MFVWTLLFLAFANGTPPLDNAAFTESQSFAEIIPVDTQRVVKLLFDEPHIDLGKVVRGEKRSATFGFINAGTEAIEIELVSACECTTVDYPRSPILPGKRGSIDIVFDSAEKTESETIEIDIYLKNKDPKTGYQMMEFVSYGFEM